MSFFLEPAFGEKNRRISFWIIKVGLAGLAYFFFMYPEDVMVHHDRDRGLAVADGKLRAAAFQRMREACFTEEEIRDYWYRQEFSQAPNKLLVLVRGREALCGGRGLCGCKGKERLPDSV